MPTPPRSLFAGRHPLLWLVVAAMIALTIIVVTSSLPVILDSYLHDDSFYYLKPAESLAAGHGSTFDGINYTNGYQPGWFAILTVGYAAGIGHDAMVIAGIVAQTTLFVGGMFALSAAFVSLGIDAAAAAAAIGIVFCGLVPVLGWNLLESGLVFLATSMLLNALTRPSTSPFALGLIVSIAALARTDHLLFVPLVMAWFLRQLHKRGRGWSPIVAFAIPIAILIGGYLLINWSTTGSIMPVSGRVKVFASSNWNWRETLTHLLHIDVRQIWKAGLLVAVLIAIRDLARREIRGLTIYCIGALAICAYYQLTYTIGFSAAFWYYIPLYVLCSYALAAVLHQLTMVRVLPRLGAVAIMTALMLAFVAARARVLESYRQRPEGERAQIYRLALVLREKLQGPQDRAAAWDAGILGYYGGAVTNLDGLVNSADYFERYLSKGKTADYIREQRFRYLVCYESYTLPNGRASGVLGDYHRIYQADNWVILERNN